MAPSKSPAFAVCGGVSVETVVAGVGRRRSSSKATRSQPVTGLAESLYADLLWDCGGANVENATAAVGTASSTQPTLDEDFADVFGGPPKFASFRRGLTRVSVACANDALLIQSSLSIPFNSSGFDMSIGEPRLSISQDNLTSSPSSAKSVKLRARSETEFSSRICYSDSDNKCSLQRKNDIASSGKEAVPSGASRTASTFMKRREFSRSDVEDDTKDTILSRPSRKNITGMKENIEGFTKVRKSEHEGQLANVHESVACSLKDSHEAKQKSGCSVQHTKAHRQNNSSKLKRKDNHDDLWVTIKDILCATEPSRFPPPSRPPPELSSDAAYVVRNSHEAPSSTDDWQNSSSPALPIHSIFDSGSISSSCTQDSNTKATSHSRVIEDAVEIAEAKIRMVLEAREKAKSMVEKKLREKRRAQQLKERSATEGKPRAERDLKGHMKDWSGEKGNSRAPYCKDEVNKHEADRTRRRDMARQCIEKAARELQSKSAENVQERAAELRLSHNFSEQPVEAAEVDVIQKPVHIEATSRPGHFWSETSGGHQKQSTCEDGCEKVTEEVIPATRTQQQDSLSSTWCSTEQKEFSEFSSLDEMDSMSSKHKTAVFFHGGESLAFQEIMGETLERRMVRWDRYCHTAARMVKALEDKKQRDLEVQKEQAERHRAAEMLDEEIKVWAAGKEGNLEALLCSLHLVLWPECGWKGVSPADLATTAAVKKTYRQATLCVHPDKVQQRGATVAQKYIAEKVFDLLREASTKYV